MDNLSAVTNEGGKQVFQLVTFLLGNEEYCVDVMKVKEIIRVPEITTMPNSPRFVAGIISLRGKVIPTILIRERFNLGSVDLTPSSRIIVMGSDDNLMGFIVDSVSEVIRIPESEIKPPPSVAACSFEQSFISGIINSRDAMRIYLNLDEMFSEVQQK